MKERDRGFFIAIGALLLFLAGIAADVAFCAATTQKMTDGEKKASLAAAVGVSPFYHYTSRGKKDPFMPFMETDPAVIKAKQEALKQKSEKPGVTAISPLQRDDISKFQLVGIAIGESEKTAIVEDKVAKKHYPVFVGTMIGIKEGRVVEIFPDRLIIEERVQGDNKKTGKTRVKRIEVFLHKEQ
jgi:Tfp pilus assembly protein PilP